MAPDPFHARHLAATVAVAGLAVMIIKPSWNLPPLAFGIASLITFGLLTLFTDGWPKRRRGRRRIWVEVVVDDDPPPREPADFLSRSQDAQDLYPEPLPAVRARRQLQQM